MNRIILLIIVLSCLFSCFDSGNVKEIPGSSEQTTDNVLLVENESFKEVFIPRQKIKFKKINTLDIKLSSNINTARYGIALKNNISPFIINDILVFNTNKGVCYYSLVSNELMKIIEGVNYYDKDLKSGTILLANKEKITLVNIADASTLWEIKNPESDFDSIYLLGNYVVLNTSVLRITTLDKKNGNILWVSDYEELLKSEVLFSSNENWKKKEEVFYKLSQFSNFVLNNGEDIIIGLDNGYLLCINIKNGKEKWRSNLRYPANGVLVSSADKVFISSSKGKILVADIENGKIDFIFQSEAESDFRFMTTYDNYLIALNGLITAINIDDMSVKYSYRVKSGTVFPQSAKVSGDYIWVNPVNPYDSDAYFRGYNLSDISSSRVFFEPEGRGYAPMEVAEGMLEEDKNIERFKKNHLLLWKGDIILVEPDKIISYKIVPQE